MQFLIVQPATVNRSASRLAVVPPTAALHPRAERQIEPEMGVGEEEESHGVGHGSKVGLTAFVR